MAILDKFNIFSGRPGLVAAQKALNYILSERMIRILIGFLIHPLVVRSLGPKGYGFYGYAISIFSVFQPFVTYGAEDQVLKDLVIDQKSANKIANSVFLLKLFFAFISYLLLIATVLLLPEYKLELLLLCLVLGAYNFFAAFNISEISLQAKMDFKSISFGRFVSFTIASIYKVIFVIYELNVIHLGLAYVLEIFLMQVFVFKKSYWKVQFSSFDINYIKKLLTLTWPLFITYFILNFSQRVSVFYLESYYDLDLVGQFVVIQNLLKYIDFVPLTILAIILPKIIETQKRNIEQYNYRISAIYFVMIALGLSCFLFFYLFSDMIVFTLYGNKFSLVAKYLPYSILVSTVLFVNYSKAKHFILENKNFEWMIYNILSFVILNILLRLWVPPFGIEGALLALGLSYIIADLLFFTFLKNSRFVYFSIGRSFMIPYKFIKNKL